jgi:hypothetical protein
MNFDFFLQVLREDWCPMGQITTLDFYVVSDYYSATRYLGSH